MTSIEWLYKLSKQRELDKFDLEQAKEIHKQEIINAYNQGASDAYPNGSYIEGNTYYQETFKKDSSKEQQKQLITEIMDLDAKDGLYEDDVEKLAHQYNPVMKLDAEFIRAGFKAGYNKAKETLYTEISDEEIEKAAFDYVENSEEDKWTATLTFIAGIKWYREQLKKQ
jgi:hypothetical protein